jgi:hypothetical protein
MSYLYALTEELVAALQAKGAQPMIEEGDECEVLRFVDSELYYSVDGTSVSLNEFAAVGGNVMVSYWGNPRGRSLTDFAAEIVRESLPLVAERSSNQP